MFHFPTLVSDYYECMAAIGFAVIMGRVLHAKTEVMLAAIVGAILTDSYAGVFGAVFMCFLFKMADYLNLGD